MTASVQTKSNKYYIVIRYKDANNKWMSKWVSTQLNVDGHNKRKAEKRKGEILKEWEKKLATGSNILFADYMRQWLTQIKNTISGSTYVTYKNTVENVICPYFKEKNISLCDLRPFHIQDFYQYKMDKSGVTANTICHYHANISRALNDAKRLEMIPKNPAASVNLPKKEKHIANCYSADELNALIKKTKGTNLETVILLASWFGLRRGEIIGLKWSCVDFVNKTLSIIGVMSDKGERGSKTKNIHYVPDTKTKSSYRSFPLNDDMVDYLRRIKQAQDRRKMQINYNHQWDDFVCVKPNGDLITPDYVTRRFPQVCVECGLKRLKLHELRHTNISLLLNEPNISMKELQEWAGHSTYNTTANTYAHLQTDAKVKLSSSICDILAKNKKNPLEIR